MKAEWTNSDSLTTTQTTKAILVVDMPVNGCESCMFDSYGCRCLIKANMTDIEKMWDRTYCPLKPMPSRKNNQESVMVGSIDMDIGYILGWNACLKEITE